MRPGPSGDTGAAKIAAVIARLKEYGYLNDSFFRRNLRSSPPGEYEKLGQRRVRQALGQKGVATGIRG